MKQKSNAELLALLVGIDTAKALASRPLAEIFGFAKPRQQHLCEEMTPYVVHPALAAAKELFTRCFSEQLSTGDLNLSSPVAVQSVLLVPIRRVKPIRAAALDDPRGANLDDPRRKRYLEIAWDERQ